MNAVIAGVRVENDTATFIPETAVIRPTRDHIILEPLAWGPSSYLEIVYFGKPLKGRVLAIGPGTYPLKYNGRKGQRSKSWESARFVRTEVAVGDVVELGGLELRGYLFHSFYWGHRKCLMVREEDVCFIHEI